MKKRYIFIPLIIMGLILLVSPFIIRVNAEEETRDIGNNTYMYQSLTASGGLLSDVYMTITPNSYNYYINNGLVNGLTGNSSDTVLFWLGNGNTVSQPNPNNNNCVFVLGCNNGALLYWYRDSNGVASNYININYTIKQNTRIYIQLSSSYTGVDVNFYEDNTFITSLSLLNSTFNKAGSGFYTPRFNTVSFQQFTNPNGVIDLNNFPSTAPITNIISYPVIKTSQNNYYYFKEFTRVWEDSYNNDEYVELVNFTDSADNEYIIRLYRPLPNERSVITHDTYLQLYDDTNNVMYYNKIYDKEESFNIYYDDYNGYIHFYHMRQNIVNGNIQFVEYDHIYNFTGIRKLTSISCDLESVSSASFTDYSILSGSDINEQVLLYTLNRIVSNWDTVFNNGYNAGYAAGQAGENSISPFVNIITTVFTGIDSVLQIEMIPHIKLWYFIAIPLTFVVLWGVFKIFKSH